MRSKPYHLVKVLFGAVWQTRYHEDYKPTGRDMREASLFLDLNEEEFEDVESFQDHVVEYMKSNWEGWLNQKHPCHGLLRNYNTYAPKKVAETVKRVQMIACPDCGKAHKATELCPECQKVR